MVTRPQLCARVRPMQHQSVQVRFELTDGDRTFYPGRMHLSAQAWQLVRRVLERGCVASEVDLVIAAPPPKRLPLAL